MKGSEFMLKIPKPDEKPQMPTIRNIPTNTKIKTIAENDPELFDYEVNELLKNGWTLVDRRVIVPNESKLIVFYAALEKICIFGSDVCMIDEKVGEI